MDEEQFEDLAKKVDSLTSAIRAIAHGGTSGPTGLEMVAMAMAGNGLVDPVGTAIEDGFHEVATALREGLDGVADAIRYAAKQSQLEVEA